MKIKDRLGYLPVSVWNLGKSRFFKHLMIKDVIKATQHMQKLEGVEDAKMGRVMGSLTEKRYKKTFYKFSEFNPVVAERIIRYWSEEGDTILNPFSSRAIIPMVASVLNRHGYAYEIVPAYYEVMEKRAKQLLRQKPLEDKFGEIKLFLGDARNMWQIKDETIDLVVTSPPYACKEVGSGEFYESSPGQLTDIKTYDGFLQALRDSIKEQYRVLKDGKYCVWVIADVRGHHRLYPLHVDIIKIFQEEGFIPHDIIINVLRTPLCLAVGKRVEDKIMQKIHEYVMVFKKPEEVENE